MGKAQHCHTFMAETHFHFKGLELLRHIGLGLAAHPLPRPLLEAVELLVDVHDDFCFEECGSGVGLVINVELLGGLLKTAGLCSANARPRARGMDRGDSQAIDQLLTPGAGDNGTINQTSDR